MAYSNHSKIAAEALTRARSGLAVTNYPAVFSGFMERGIPETEIIPRENVLTFHAWRALGRTVKRGEHGVRIVTWIDCDKRDDDGEVVETYRRPKTTIVFHVSQTKELEARQ